MKYRKVYICSEHTNDMLELNSYWPLFTEVNDIIYNTPGLSVPDNLLGQADFVIKGNDGLLLIVAVKKNLDEKLATFEPPASPSTFTMLYGKRYDMDIRNDSHNLIHSIGVLLKILETEQEKNGSVWFYNMSAVDDINLRILRLIKRAGEAVTLAAIADTIKMAYAHQLPSNDELWERLALLRANYFIADSLSEGGVVKWYPTEKSIRIQPI